MAEEKQQVANNNVGAEKAVAEAVAKTVFGKDDRRDNNRGRGGRG